jgi:hypothetical protein
MPREYAGRARGPARALCVLDLKGRIQQMVQQAQRRGCTDHQEALTKFSADLAAATAPEIERVKACQLLDRLVEDADTLIMWFDTLEQDAASIACSMELEGIQDAIARVRGAFEGGRRNRTAGRIRWRVSLPAERNHQDEIDARADDYAPALAGDGAEQ